MIEELNPDDYTPEQMIGVRAIALWGHQSQMQQAAEELAELIQAIMRSLNSRDGDNLCEEIADVEIMLMQLKLMVDNEEIEKYKAEKLKRLDGIIMDHARRISARVAADELG